MQRTISAKKSSTNMRYYFFYLPIFLLCATLCSTGSDISMQENDPIYTSFKQFLGTIYHYTHKSLNGGLSNNTQYIYSINEHTYVVRMLQESLAKRKNEINTHLLAASKDIAPFIYFYADDYSFIILEFIHDHTLHIEQAKKYTILDLIANKVRLISHFDACILENDNQPDLFHQIIADYNLIKNQGNEDFKVLIAQAFHDVKNIYDTLEHINRPLVFNHNDLHPRNIFFTQGDIKIIDWETAAMNYEFYDLACYSVYSCLNEREDQYLLTQYLQRQPLDADIKQYHNVKQMLRVFMAFAFLKLLNPMPQSIAIKEIKDFEYYMKTFAQDANANAPDFLYALALSFLQEFFREYKISKPFNSIATLQ